MKIHKINSRCNEAQRAEVTRTIVENDSCSAVQKQLNRATAKAQMFEKKAQKWAKKIQTLRGEVQKQEAKKDAQQIADAEKARQQVYCAPVPQACAAPLINTTQVAEDAQPLLMPPPQERTATYTLEQVQALLNMERERLQKQ